MKRWLSWTCAVVFLLAGQPDGWPSSRLLAQATGQINGIVVDSSGAVLPGVSVEAVHIATGAERTAVTGADGLYTLPLLQPGDYNVKATLSGFRVALREGVRVTVTETARVTSRSTWGRSARR